MPLSPTNPKCPKKEREIDDSNRKKSTGRTGQVLPHHMLESDTDETSSSIKACASFCLIERSQLQAQLASYSCMFPSFTLNITPLAC